MAYCNGFNIVEDHIALILCDLSLFVEFTVGTFITIVLILLWEFLPVSIHTIHRLMGVEMLPYMFVSQS
jgi:hypothetical protein